MLWTLNVPQQMTSPVPGAWLPLLCFTLSRIWQWWERNLGPSGAGQVLFHWATSPNLNYCFDFDIILNSFLWDPNSLNRGCWVFLCVCLFLCWPSDSDGKDTQFPGLSVWCVLDIINSGRIPRNNVLLKAVPPEDFAFQNSEVQALACHLVAFQTRGLRTSWSFRDPSPQKFPWDLIIYLS